MKCRQIIRWCDILQDRTPPDRIPQRHPSGDEECDTAPHDQEQSRERENLGVDPIELRVEQPPRDQSQDREDPGSLQFFLDLETIDHTPEIPGEPTEDERVQDDVGGHEIETPIKITGVPSLSPKFTVLDREDRTREHENKSHDRHEANHDLEMVGWVDSSVGELVD